MPLGVTCEIYRTYQEKRCIRDNFRTELTAAENYLDKKIHNLNGAYICSQQIEVNRSDNAITITNQTLAEISAGAAKETMIE